GAWSSITERLEQLESRFDQAAELRPALAKLEQLQGCLAEHSSSVQDFDTQHRQLQRRVERLEQAALAAPATQAAAPGQDAWQSLARRLGEVERCLGEESGMRAERVELALSTLEAVKSRTLVVDLHDAAIAGLQQESARQGERLEAAVAAVRELRAGAPAADAHGAAIAGLREESARQGERLEVAVAAVRELRAGAPAADAHGAAIADLREESARQGERLEAAVAAVRELRAGAPAADAHGAAIADLREESARQGERLDAAVAAVRELRAGAPAADAHGAAIADLREDRWRAWGPAAVAALAADYRDLSPEEGSVEQPPVPPRLDAAAVVRLQPAGMDRDAGGAGFGPAGGVAAAFRPPPTISLHSPPLIVFFQSLLPWGEIDRSGVRVEKLGWQGLAKSALVCSESIGLFALGAVCDVGRLAAALAREAREAARSVRW
ncbi:unnamed protein product, partial [Prorocentrum cordatum]